MRITLLGTGSPEAHVRRASSGYLVEIGEACILLDCGGGVFDRLLQSGRRPSDITHLFFTHLHSDHMMDYARLVHAAWDEGAAPLQVFGPAPIATITTKLFGRDGVLSADLTARTENRGSQEVWLARGGTLPRPWPSPEVVEIVPGFAYRADGWTLTTCEVPHAQPHLTCMAFRIDTPTAAFVYSGDAGPSEALEQLAAGADVLLHWCYRLGHETTNAYVASMSMPPEAIAAMAERIGVKRLIITHLRAHMDTDSIHQTIQAQLCAHFSGPASIAEDLMTLELAPVQAAPAVRST